MKDRWNTQLLDLSTRGSSECYNQMIDLRQVLHTDKMKQTEEAQSACRWKLVTEMRCCVMWKELLENLETGWTVKDQTLRGIASRVGTKKGEV